MKRLRSFRRGVCLASVAFLLAGPAAKVFAANILWVTDFFTDGAFSPPGTDVNDTNFIVILQNAGHNVWRFNPPAGQNTLLTAQQLQDINTNDLIIVGRATDSGAFQSGQQGNQWNTNISKPLMMNSCYLLRNSRLGWFTGETVPDVAGTLLTAVNVNDPKTAYIFGGVTMNGSTTADVFDVPIDRNLSCISVAPVAGGTVLATAASGATVIADFPAGTVVRSGSNVLAGYRMFFAAGSREAASPGGVANSGKDNLTAAGKSIFLRAVDIALNSGSVPAPATPPAITNQPQSLTVTQGLTASFTVGASGTSLTYHWNLNNALIAGANARTFTIADVDPTNAGNYTVIVSNAAGSVTSDVAVLTVPLDTIAPVLLSAVGNAAGDAIVITYSEPVDPGVGGEGSNYQVKRASDNTDWPIGSATLLNPRTVVLTNLDLRIVGENYILQAFDVPDRFGNPLEPNPTVVTVRSEVVVIKFDSDNDWKYEISGTDLTSAGWQAPGYNDTFWPFGPAPLGLDASAGMNGQPVIRTVIPYDASKFTTYFRKRFQVPGPPVGGTIRLRHVVEDGAVFYLNGVEIYRHRMPGGPIAYNTLATGAPDPTPVEGPVTITVTNLVEGENVLAVSVHQSSTGSSDIEFTAEVTATVSQYVVNPPVIVSQPQSQTVVETAPVTLDVTLSQGTFLNYQWYFNTNLLPGATNRAIQYASVQPSQQGDYFLIVSNSAGMATSAVATVTVLLDTNAPSIRSVRASSLDTVVVIFSEAVDPASAASATNYGIADGNGNCCIAATTATLSNATAVILTLATQLTPGLSHTARISNVADRASSPNLLANAQAPVQMPGSQRGNIVWVSDNPGSNGFSPPVVGFEDDVWVTNFLQVAGYNVIRYSSDNAATNLMSPADIAALNTNDLIIVSRSTGSGAYAPPQGSQWNTNITKPMIVMSAYLLRSNNLSWFITSDTPPDDTQTTLGMTNLASPAVAYLFQDVALRGNSTIDPYDHPLDRNMSMITGPMPPGGMLIAVGVQLGANAIASLPGGTAVRGGTEVLAGYRMYFAGGSRETSAVPTAGKDNLTPTGEAIFLRAVQLAMNGGTVPNPVVPQPLVHPSYSGGIFSAAIQTVNGVNYTVQYKNDLSASMWNTLTTIAGDGTVQTFTDPNPPDPNRFYRVILP